MAIDNISVIKLRNLLLVTVPPDPDDQTVSALQEEILEAMAQHESRGLVLDISTVQTMDSFFARTIAETVQMVGLMGGRTVLAGMRASVAVTATQLGLTMGKALTALDVDRAFEMLDGGRSTRLVNNNTDIFRGDPPSPPAPLPKGEGRIAAKDGWL